MATIYSFRDLDAWKAAMALVVVTYEIVRELPQSERFELATQIRRAAVSIPSNIAEGQATGPGGRYRHHVRIALGSLAELETQLEIAARLHYLSENALRLIGEHVGHTGRLLHGLNRSLRRRFAVSCLTFAGMAIVASAAVLS